MSKQVLGTQATNVKLVGFNEKNKQYQELENGTPMANKAIALY